MARKRFFLILLIVIMFNLNFVSGCINSLDSYAVEILFNKENMSYDLSQLLFMKNVEVKNSEYIMQSQYSKNLASIVKEENVSGNKFFSLRLQLPAKEITEKKDTFSLISLISGKKMNISHFGKYNGWKIVKEGSSYILRKDNILIYVVSIGEKNDILLEVYEKFQSCEKCDGKCVYGSSVNPYGNICIPNRIKKEINNILKFVIDTNFDELFINYRVSRNGEKYVSDIISEYKTDFKEAVKQELVFLQKNKILNITNSEIEELVKLADEGRAGNSKIVYSNKWTYYYQIFEMNSKKICNEFLVSEIPKNKPVPIDGNTPFYIIPLIIGGGLFLIILILILIGRLIDLNYRKKISSRKWQG